MSSLDIPAVVSPAQKIFVRTLWRRVSNNTNGSKPTTTPNGSSNSRSEQRVFGVPLTESIRYARSRISYLDPTTNHRCYGVIPTIIAKCGAYLKQQGLMVEGVFRISGSNRRIGMLQEIFDDADGFGANFKWEGEYTVHDAANVMRRFLNHLPEPVMTLEYYRAFKDTMNQNSTLDAKIENFQNLINRLPPAHQYLLLYIMDMLGLFAMTKDKTLMDTSALAAVFVPGMLSHPDDELNPAGYKESQRVLEFLIEHQHRLTVPPSYVYPKHSVISSSGYIARKPSDHLTTMATATDITRVVTNIEKGKIKSPIRGAAMKLERSATSTKGRKTRSPFIDAAVSFPYDSAISSNNLKRSQSVPCKPLVSRGWRPVRHGTNEVTAVANDSQHA